MKRIIVGVLALMAISCSQNTKKFSLNGKTNGLKDGTIVLMKVDGQVIDSAEITNNSFEFHTKLPQSPMEVELGTKDGSQYRYLWLENNPMTLDATRSDLRKADVSGSENEDLSELLSKRTDTIPRNKRHKYRIELISDNPDKLFSAYLLSFYATTWGKETTEKLFSQFSEENKNSQFGKSISQFIDLYQEPQIGEKYIDFEMTDNFGKKRKLSEFDGKLVLLEFWASNCGPCIQENPNLVKTYNEFQPKGFEIFAVSEDYKKENWLKAIEKDKLPWTQVSELSKKNTAFMIYGVNGIPDNFLIDQNGTIIARNIKGQKLKDKLNELLN